MSFHHGSPTTRPPRDPCLGRPWRFAVHPDNERLKHLIGQGNRPFLPLVGPAHSDSAGGTTIAGIPGRKGHGARGQEFTPAATDLQPIFEVGAKAAQRPCPPFVSVLSTSPRPRPRISRETTRPFPLGRAWPRPPRPRLDETRLAGLSTVSDSFFRSPRKKKIVGSGPGGPWGPFSTKIGGPAYGPTWFPPRPTRSGRVFESSPFLTGPSG